jgi:hypothetical protein
LLQFISKMVKGQNAPQVRCPRILRSIVETLFPEQTMTPMINIVRESDEGTIPAITVDELLEASRKIGDNKAPRRCAQHSSESRHTKETRHVHQTDEKGSVLGPLLWNIMYDEVLRLKLPEGVTLIGFADDIAVVMVAKHIHQIEAATNAAIMKIRDWLKIANVDLANHKTEAILVTGRKATD